MSDRNDLASWFPKLLATRVPIPRTAILSADPEGLWPLLDGQYAPALSGLCQEIASAAKEIAGFPCFLRTGYGSGKHYWRRICHVRDAKQIAAHVRELVEWSACVDLAGLPISTWVVRELLPVEPFFHAFQGMPITRERRCFVRDGALVCRHPYWPPDSIHGATDEDVKRLHEDNEAGDYPSDALIETAAAPFKGAWSQDWLWTKRGWVLIDMAVAEQSFHWPWCNR